MLFYTGDRKRYEKMLLPVVRQYIVPGGEQQFLPFLAAFKQSEDAWGAFELGERDSPAAVIHDTANNDNKYVLKNVTPKRLEKFLAEYWEGTLIPIGGAAAAAAGDGGSKGGGGRGGDPDEL
jgi:hypothetical protein